MKLTEPLVLVDGIERPRFYSPLADTTAGLSGNLPHWDQRGKAAFVTFRLADSLPSEKLVKMREDEAEWLRHHPKPWDTATSREYDEVFNARIEHWLDNGHGECLMRDAAIRALVESALRYFDGARYRLYGFVVMPNHVHVCFMPFEDYVLSDVLQSWKSFSAKAINKALGRSGTVWQKEYFDRYIRNGEHFDRVLRYIRRNDPSVAWLATKG